MEHESKKLKLAAIHEILPIEIFVMILKKLGYKSLGKAKLTCREWKKVIDDFGLRKFAIGKFWIKSFRFRITSFFLKHNLFREGFIFNTCWRFGKYNRKQQTSWSHQWLAKKHSIFKTFSSWMETFSGSNSAGAES